MMHCSLSRREKWMAWLMVERTPGKLVRMLLVSRVMLTPVQVGNTSTVTVCSDNSMLWSHCSLM